MANKMINEIKVKIKRLSKGQRMHNRRLKQAARKDAIPVTPHKK